MSEIKPILCIDFDGVIHSYDNGWRNGEIYGHVVDGFWPWAAHAQKLFQLVIYSSRSKDSVQRDAMAAWMDMHWKHYLHHHPNAERPVYEFAHEKPPAFLTIDDRVVRFDGNWDDMRLLPDALRDFMPWMARR